MGGLVFCVVFFVFLFFWWCCGGVLPSLPLGSVVLFFFVVGGGVGGGWFFGFGLVLLGCWVGVFGGFFFVGVFFGGGFGWCGGFCLGVFWWCGCVFFGVLGGVFFFFFWWFWVVVGGSLQEDRFSLFYPFPPPLVFLVSPPNVEPLSYHSPLFYFLLKDPYPPPTRSEEAKKLPFNDSCPISYLRESHPFLLFFSLYLSPRFLF